MSRDKVESWDNLEEKLKDAKGKGKTQLLQKFFNSDMSVHVRHTGGSVLLKDACCNNQEEIVNILLKYKPNIYQTDDQGYTALHHASSAGNVNIVKILLDYSGRQKNILLDAKTAEGFTALHIAAKGKFLDVVKCLLKYGAIYDILDKQGKTAKYISEDDNVINFLKLVKDLFTDIQCGKIDVIDKLKELSADDADVVIKARKCLGNTLFRTAIIHKKDKIIYELIKIYKDEQLLKNIYVLFHLEYLKLALSKMIGDPKYEQPLINNFINLVEKKLEDVYFEKLVVNCVNGFSIAIKNLIERVEKQFISEDPNFGSKKLRLILNKQTEDGSTALHLAAKYGHLDIVKLLLQYGAIYNISNKSDKKPVSLTKDQPIIAFLLKVDSIFDNIKKGDIECLDWLQKQTPNDISVITKARNNENQTILVLAAENENDKITFGLVKIIDT